MSHWRYDYRSSSPVAACRHRRRSSHLGEVDTLIADAQTHETPPAAVTVAVRYVLAIQATDARGDACRFPRCACHVMDCSLRRPKRR